MPGVGAGSLGLTLFGAALLVVGALGLRWSGAHAAMGRRLAGARQMRVGDLLDLDRMPARPVRVAGRIRCPDPIVTSPGGRLVAVHRDVEVQLPGGGWRTIERVRETRGFELWDHAGALPIDPAAAAEPLVVIPHVWRGDPGELGPEHRAALERLAGEGGEPRAARSVTRTLSVVERLLVLAQVQRGAGGTITLAPPPGGYVISALELDDAMRLLGGSRKAALLASAAAMALGAAALLLGLVLLGASALTG